MNKHFEDARYYLKQAGKKATKGVREELEPIEERFRELTGREKEPEPGRLEKVRDDLEDLQKRAEGEANKAISDAIDRIDQYRNES
jgi:DNA-binding PadR family transcriptional regulator